jgi:hypothetical protein
LRRYLRLSIAAVAQRVGTRPEIIAALEAGQIEALPVWSETARIVAAYIGLANLDPRPALDRLSVLMQVTANASPQVAQARPVPGRGAAANPVSRIISRLSQTAVRTDAPSDRPERVGEWLAYIAAAGTRLAAELSSARAPVRWVLASALALIVMVSVAPSGVLQASVGGIAQPISGFWRKLSGEGSAVRVIMNDGLKWIEAEDPRERRSDKLPSRRS